MKAAVITFLLWKMHFVYPTTSPTFRQRENELTPARMSMSPSTNHKGRSSFLNPLNVLLQALSHSLITMNTQVSYQPTAQPTTVQSTPKSTYSQSSTPFPTILPTSLHPSARPSLYVELSQSPSDGPTPKLTTKPQRTVMPSSKPITSAFPSSSPTVQNPFSLKPSYQLTRKPSIYIPTMNPSARPSLYVELSQSPSDGSTSKLTTKPQRTIMPSSKPITSAFPSSSPIVKNPFSLKPSYQLTRKPSIYIPPMNPSTRPSLYVELSQSPSDGSTPKLTTKPQRTIMPSSKPITSAFPSSSPTVKKNPRLTRKPTLVEFKPITHPSSIPLKTATRKPSLLVKPTINPSLAPVIRNILTFKPSPAHTFSEKPNLKYTPQPSSLYVPHNSKQPTHIYMLVSSSLQLEMGIIYDVMDLTNQQRFESIMNEWLDSIFISYSPPIQNFVVKLVAQRLQPVSKRRKLASAASNNGQSVTMDLNFAGIEQAFTSISIANMQFKENLINTFQNDTTTASLVSLIQERVSNDTLYVYFSHVSKVSLPKSAAPSPISRNNWTPAVVGGVVGGLGFLFLAVAMIVLLVMRHQKRKKPMESSRVSLPIDHFHYTHDNDDVYPSRGPDEIIIHHDEASSTGTFKTLENIHMKDAASNFSNADFDFVDNMNSIHDAENPRGFVGDLFETSDGQDAYSLSLGSLTGGATSELDNGSLMNKSESGSEHMSVSSISRARKECIAPPGRLGIVIDTTRYGPIIHDVKVRSPMENILFAGDRIISVDDIDTSRMTASEVTKIMTQKAGTRRKITVISGRQYSS